MSSPGQAIFYVYILFRPNGVPCYVGKGKGNRWTHHERFSHSHYNKHLARIITNARMPLPKVKVRVNLTEDDALATEIAFIRAIGREVDGGPLVNLTDGGDGKSGYLLSEETKARISQAHKGKTISVEAKAKISAALKGVAKPSSHGPNVSVALMGHSLSEETKRKIGKANRGRKHSEKSSARKSESSIARWKEPEYAKTIVAAIRDRWANTEYREKMSKIRRELWSTPEFRANMAAAKRSARERRAAQNV